jgi:hypothetical protein
VAALIAVEVASNLVQYGAAFALLVQLRPATAQRSITYLTLIAGFASTIFWPITTLLHAHLSWQNVYLIFAALNLFVCLPLHAWLARGTQARSSAAREVVQSVEGLLPPERRRTGFILMVAGFSLMALINSAILVHMLPLLSGLGLGASAALIGTLFGPSQVLSRFINMIFGRNLSAVYLATIAAVLLPAGVFSLTLSAPSIPGAIIFAMIFGMGSGLMSIVTGTLPLALFGSDGYGKLQGKMSAARLIVSAIAPFCLALSMDWIGVLSSLLIVAGIGTLASTAFFAIDWLVRYKQRQARETACEIG